MRFLSLVLASYTCFVVSSSYYLRKSTGKTATLIWLSFPLACTGMLIAIADTFCGNSDFQHLVLGLSSWIACVISIGLDPDYCQDLNGIMLVRLFPSHLRQPDPANEKPLSLPLAVFLIVCRVLLFVYVLELIYMLFLIVH